MKKLRLLILSAREPSSPLLDALDRAGLAADCGFAPTPEMLQALLAAQAWDAAVVESGPDGWDWAEAHRLLRARAPGLPLASLCRTPAEEKAARAAGTPPHWVGRGNAWVSLAAWLASPAGSAGPDEGAAAVAPPALPLPARLADLFWDHGDEGILLIRADGAVAEANTRGRLALPPDLLAGERFESVLHADDQRRWENMRHEARDRAPAAVRGELRLRDALGSWRPVDTALSDATGAPGVGALVLRFRDLGARRLEEERLSQARKLDAVARLAGTLAHDFNNLLTVITGYCDILQASLPQGDPGQETVGEVKKAADRATGLTRQLLAFSRKPAGGPPKPLGLNLVVADMHPLLRRLLGENVRLNLDLDPTLATVRADAGQMEQALMQLAMNARDAMPAGGEFTLRTRNMDITPELARTLPNLRPGRHVSVSVSDTGTGMGEETLRRLFEPFFSTKEKALGVGMGLCAVYGMVRQAGGDIEVESQPGRGSTFTLYLPAGADLPDRLAPSPAASARVRGPISAGTVLLVEDEDGVRSLCRQILALDGHRILDTGDPHRALDIFQQNRDAIQVLVTDVVMPGMSGLELAKRVVIQKPDIKVLYMSGYADLTVSKQGILAADSAFLHKPFTPDAFSGKVQELLTAGKDVAA